MVCKCPSRKNHIDLFCKPVPIPASLLRIQNNWLMVNVCPCQDLNRFQLNHNYCLAPCPSINQNNEILGNCIDWRRWEEPILAHHHRWNFYNCVCEVTPQPWKLEWSKCGFHKMRLFRTSIQLTFRRQWTIHITYWHYSITSGWQMCWNRWPRFV